MILLFTLKVFLLLSSLGQMAKNKLTIQNPKALLAEMYILVMGDEAEDVDDVSNGNL